MKLCRRVVLVTLLDMSVVLTLVTFAGIAYAVLNIAILHWCLVLQQTFPSLSRYMKGLVGFSVAESTTRRSNRSSMATDCLDRQFALDYYVYRLVSICKYLSD